MDSAEFSLEIGRNWMTRAREQDPQGYQRTAWRLYCEAPDEILMAALLSELSAGLSEEALDLRATSEKARAVPAEDLLRSGMLALQVALEGLRHEDWEYVVERAQAMALDAMSRRADRPD
ncbi:MAG: hypothetical protein KF760_21905 [Candidatus Eremiobacteraeota bacterium]|nr:hypothetical protein [Candidatus Eremiobacteraeota bacterium]